MINYLQNSIKEYLDDLSSNKPAPGGGSASALVGCLGISCLLMVANFTINKHGYEKYQNEIKEIIKKLKKIKRDLAELVNKDVIAYEKVANAYKLPKNTETEIRKRKKEIQIALINALRVPKEIILKCLSAMPVANRLSKIGNKNLITDVGCGLNFLQSCAESAKLNIDINLKFLKNKSLIKKTKKEIKAVLTRIKKIFMETRKKIQFSMEDSK
ncbi:MAG: cyclodeaminase/cyclohydrolase family protein [Endomicrobiia bacterium]